ncbi:MAG: glycosyltransferase, partial [Candidatus Omnitrophica bacterium]|nr:glycosyltransferase [Candidatus Omnitrophota bacterium]
PLEMMAAGGTAVVAPNGGNLEYLKDEENCLLYGPGNINQAVDNIQRIVEDKGLRDRLIEGGLKTAQSRSWDNITADILKLYE